MNPETNKLEKLTNTNITEIENQIQKLQSTLLRPNGEPVPQHWTIFTQGQNVVVNNYTFKIAHMNESCIILEPISAILDEK